MTEELCLLKNTQCLPSYMLHGFGWPTLGSCRKEKLLSSFYKIVIPNVCIQIHLINKVEFEVFERNSTMVVIDL